MKGDFHVRICERLKLECFGLLDPAMNPCPSAMQNVRLSKKTETQSILFFDSIDQIIQQNNEARLIDLFVESINLVDFSL